MQRLEVSGAVRPIYGSLGVKRLRDVVEKYAAAEKATNDNIMRRKHFPCWMDT